MNSGLNNVQVFTTLSAGVVDLSMARAWAAAKITWNPPVTQRAQQYTSLALLMLCRG